MKKTIIIAVTTIISASIIGLGCFAGCAARKNTSKQTVSGYLDQTGNIVEATVDITDGYSCDFTRGAIYLSENDKEGNEKSIAIAMTLEKEVYDEYYEKAQADKDHKDINGGVIFDAEGQMGYLRPVGDSAYFAIFAEDADKAQMESIANRFTVQPGV